MGLKQRLVEKWMDDSVAERYIAENVTGLREALDDLEMEIMRQEDLKWVRLTDATEDWEFSQQTREQLNKLALYYWMKNPLAGRAVETMTHYTFGRGVSVVGASAAVNEVIEEFWDDEDNKAVFTRHQAQEFKSNELQVYGNVFLVLFSNEASGHLKLGDIPDNEVKDIIRDVDNRHRPRYYKRIVGLRDYDFQGHAYVSKGSNTWYYPDWKSDDDREASKEAGGGAIYHVKVNCLSDMKFGVTELYRAMDWLKAYNKFLENWASITAAFARFAWKKKVKGGAATVAAEKLKHQSGVAAGLGVENNPAPAAGSLWIENMGADLQPIKTQGATTSAADGRFLKLMVSAATGIFEHYFGDPSTGNLATATAMELPMLKMFESRQQLWRDVIVDMVQLEIDQAVAYGRLKVADPDELNFEVRMPPIVTKDAPALVKAIVDAVNLGAGGNTSGLLPMEFATRQVLNALGEENPEKVIAEMYADEGGVPSKKQEKEFATQVKAMSESLDRILESAA